MRKTHNRKLRFLPIGAAKVALIVVIFSSTGSTLADDGETAAEKIVTFYATYGYREDDTWIIPLRIWVRERPDFVRRMAAKGAREEIAERAGLESLSESQKDLFMSRADGFIADSESNEEVVFVFDADPDRETFHLVNGEGESETDRNGLIEGSLKLPNDKAQILLNAQESPNGWLTYRAISEDHGGVGRVRLVGPHGVSVISDIDDTVKVTDIPAGEPVVLRNTFFNDLVAAPCMAEMYQAFGGDVAFHYVSGGPWQLYEPLAQFLFGESAGFPGGSFHMKNVRTNPFESETYQDLWTLIVNGSQQATFEQKVDQISALITRFPGRTFVLIGDSGERDPEVFRVIKERFSDQVQEIRIRDVVNDRENNAGRLEEMSVIPAGLDQDSCREFLQNGGS